MVLLVYGMSTVWEDTGGCEKQYRFDLAIYLMTVLLYLYGIIMDCEINSLGHGNNAVDEINGTEKRLVEVTNGTSW